MLAEAIRTIYDYNEWANEKIFDAAEGLGGGELDRQGTIPHGTIRQTLLHMLLVHKRFLSWWDGSLPAHEAYALMVDPADYPDLASIRAYWNQIAEQTRAFTATLTDERAAQYLGTSTPDGREFGFPLWQIMQHVANHSTQHRSEIAIMLTEAGCSPGDLDQIFYFMAPPARA